ncbi:MAG: ABC transporter ATP-binding protein [Planctomycetes bacterium]|nr:ABC transporter ATP-binding protein [Planctomycetota bacterium]
MRVELDRIGKRFGNVRALCDVSLELPAGSRTALIGPNGSGKSTLVRLLTGMLGGDGGLRFDGRPVPTERGELARRVAYMPQIAPRLAAPVADVVRAVGGLRGLPFDAIAAVAAELGVDLVALRRRPFRALSGGQRQKILAALVLSSGADLLLLDEPTASMDPKSRAVFFTLVERLPATSTILLCSHRLDEIRRLVDRVVVLEEGRLVWSGQAAGYLDEHAVAVVEVHAEGEQAYAWLGERGFLRGPTGWWSRTLPVRERAGLLRDLSRTLNGAVRDVTARDVERLEPGDAPRGEPR